MRIFFIVVIAFIFTGCSDDIVKDEATVQGLINNDFYKAVSATASIDENGYLSIRSSALEIISFRVNAADLGTYTITENGVNRASYETLEGDVYTSNHAEVIGEVTISQINEDGYDGTFFFNLKNNIGDEVFIRNGSFFNVETGTDPDDPDPTDPVSGEFLTADIDATAFDADVVNIVDESGVYTVFGSIGTSVVTVVFPNTLPAGTYDVSTEMSIQLGYSETDTVEFAQSGTLTLTEITETTISGSFEFVTTSGIQVTSGEFEVEL